ncbi:ABC transporter permease [Thalassoroseus pseudoceratinae]|uniref:ABC transporter permease n=1 Tax=Thalassoroseus pseudoceratinae TaxID=2713176 RepID=UPI0014204248|nr:ABC transporter permease [Thalassoroseus pseudoceratinae]
MLKFAYRNLRNRSLRTALSLLGLTVAIAGMIGLFSVAEGLDETVSTTFGRVPGLAAMQPGAPMPLFSTLPAAWGEEIENVDRVRAVVPEIWQRVNVINQKMIFSPPRLLYGSEISKRLQLESDLYRESIKSGRFLTLEDEGTRNCLISQPIAEEFEVEVGDSLQVNSHRVDVVGIYKCDSLLLDIAILMDIDTVRQMTRFDPGTVSSYYIEQTEETNKDDLVNEIREIFRDRDLPPWTPSALQSMAGSGTDGWIDAFTQKLNLVLKWFAQRQSSPTQVARENNGTNKVEQLEQSPAEEPIASGDTDFVVRPDMPIEVRTAESWAKRFDRLADDLNVFLGLLTAIGLFIAVLSIINTMVMSVSERIIEFGILKANGWSKRDVLKLITCESGLIGFGGGLLGCIVGWVGVQLVNWQWPTRVELYASPGLIIFGVTFATSLGVLGGLYPAFWAMRMMPMDAIRRG